jgi:hypothetical protein
VTLTADDGTEVVQTNSVTVSLAQRPRRGQPLVIEGVRLEQPNVRLVSYETASGEMGFRGLVPFVREEAIEKQDEQPESRKLSEVFELRSLDILGGMVTYVDQSGDEMTLRDVEMELALTEETGPDGQVLHSFDMDFGRRPLVGVAARGELDLDEFVVHMDGFQLDADLSSEAGRDALPPRVRELLGEKEARGMLQVMMSGSLKLREPTRSTAEAAVLIDDAMFATGDIQVPVDSVDIEASLEGGIAALTSGEIRALDGRVLISDGRLDLNQEHMPGQAVWSIDNVDLHNLMREVSASDEATSLYGIVESSGAVRIEASDVKGSLDGAGSATISEAQLVAIPVLTDLFNAADIVGILRGDTSHDDRLEAEFRVRPKGVVFDDLMISVPAAKFRGRGVFGFEQTLDFQMRGGSVEKVPLIGEAIGSVTGQLVRYDIEGTVDEPKLSVSALSGERDIDEGEDPTQTSDEAASVGEPDDAGEATPTASN